MSYNSERIYHHVDCIFIAVYELFLLTLLYCFPPFFLSLNLFSPYRNKTKLLMWTWQCEGARCVHACIYSPHTPPTVIDEFIIFLPWYSLSLPPSIKEKRVHCELLTNSTEKHFSFTYDDHVIVVHFFKTFSFD